jgi:nicotinamidase/pyrazinamidase
VTDSRAAVVSSYRPHAGDALVLVDIQNDFLPGGALAVPLGNEVIEPLNRSIGEFERHRLPIFATRDWHPDNHCSFRAQGGPWPPHCIAGSLGAQFAAQLQLAPDVRIISKGTRVDADAYSGFQDTDLAQQLRNLGCSRLVIGGLATDYCVRATAIDALAAGFEVVVLADAIRAVDVRPGDGQRALQEIRAHGAQVVATQQVLP